ESFIEHKSEDRFLIINLNAFHNAHLDRRVLPCTLTESISLLDNCKQEHESNKPKKAGQDGVNQTLTNCNVIPSLIFSVIKKKPKKRQKGEKIQTSLLTQS
ncbi:hypothetical protein K435DRAFT_681385, partial [Dendrothele bispora CBS 962.96]